MPARSSMAFAVGDGFIPDGLPPLEVVSKVAKSLFELGLITDSNLIESKDGWYAFAPGVKLGEYSSEVLILYYGGERFPVVTDTASDPSEFPTTRLLIVLRDFVPLDDGPIVAEMRKVFGEETEEHITAF